MNRLAMSVCLIFFIGTIVYAQQSGLTEYQEFKSYPFIEKAYRLQREGKFKDALSEVEKALAISPKHSEFLQLKLQLQLSSMSNTELMNLFLNYSLTEQKALAQPLLETLLAASENVPIEQYAVVLEKLPTERKAIAALAVNERLIGQERLNDSLMLLNSLDLANPDLLQQRFILSSELKEHNTTLNLYPEVSTHKDDRNLTRYLDALQSLGRDKEVMHTLSENVDRDNIAPLIEAYIQRQIGNQNYQMAEQGFELLSKNSLLTDEHRKQWRLLRIESNELTLEIDDVLQSDLPCWQKSEILVNRLRDKGINKAEQILSDCVVAVDESEQFAVASLAILSVEKLKQQAIRVPRASKMLRKGIIEKLVAEEEYEQLITLASAPEYKSMINDRSLAFAYQQTGNLAAAAETYWQIFLNQSDLQALEQATFLWSALGEDKKVINSLTEVLLSSDDILPTPLVIRYVDSLALNVEIPGSVLRNLFSLDYGIDAVAEKLRLQSNCAQSIDYIDQFELSSETAQTTKALCLQKLGGTESIAVWQELLEQSPTVENFKATLFAMTDAQRHQSALTLISSFPQYQQNVEVSQIKLQALIQIQNYGDALTEWKKQFERSSNADILTGIELALLTKRYEYANQLSNQLVSSNITLSESEWATVAQVKVAAGQPEEALNVWKLLYEQNPESDLAQINLAYANIPNNPVHALSLFRQYAQNTQKPIEPDIWNQMAYLADSIGDYSAVSYYLEKYFALQQGEYQVENQAAWSLHQLYQQSYRRWNFSASASHGNGAILGDVFFIDNNGNEIENLPNNGLSIRLSYRLFEDSKRWQAYTQINTNGPDRSPFDQQSLELGLSYRLFENVNALASAGMFYFFEGEDQLQPFLRLSADFLNQDDWRNGWRFEESWWERQWYNDVLYLVENEQIFAISRLDGGYVIPLATESKQTVKFFGLAQFDYRKQPVSTTDLEGFDQTTLGVGVQWRMFETPTTINESSSFWSASLELRHRVSGNLTNDDAGLFLTVGYQY